MNPNYINIENYEEYVLDYLEGNLSTETRAAFDAFLESNLQVKSEVADLMEYSLDKPVMTFPDKADLIKPTGSRFSFIRLLTLGALLIGIILAIVFSNSYLPKDSDLDADKNRIEQKDNAKKRQVEIEQGALSQQNTESKDEEIIQHSLTEARPVPKTQEKQVKRIEQKKQITQKANADKTQKATQVKSANLENRTKAATAKTVSTNVQSIINTSVRTSESDNETKKDTTINRPMAQITPSDKETTKTLNTNTPIIDIDEKQENEMDKIAQIDQEKPSTEEVEASYKDDTRIAIQDPIALTNHDEIALQPSTEKTKATELKNKIPDITIDIEESDDIAIADIDKNKRKKRKFSLRNFIPESFAGLTKEQLTASLVPEVITSSK